MRNRPVILAWKLLVLLGTVWLLLAGCGSESPPGPSGRSAGKQPAASQEPAGGPVKTPPVRERVGAGEALGPALHVLLPPERGQIGLTDAELQAGPPPLSLEKFQVGLTEAELKAGPPPLALETFAGAPPGKFGERDLTQAELERMLRSHGPPPAVIVPKPEDRN
jgi:hypothetical protein